MPWGRPHGEHVRRVAAADVGDGLGKGERFEGVDGALREEMIAWLAVLAHPRRISSAFSILRERARMLIVEDLDERDLHVYTGAATPEPEWRRWLQRAVDRAPGAPRGPRRRGRLATSWPQHGEGELDGSDFTLRMSAPASGWWATSWPGTTRRPRIGSYTKSRHVTLLDMLEHIEDDRGFLSDLSAKMASGSTLIMTTPALQRLWSRWDPSLGRYRRYGTRMLRSLIEPLPVRVREIRDLFP